jgi:membrane-associated phospholipid phosphatase
MQDASYRPLFARTLAALAIGAALVAGCYFFVDRPVAFYVHDHGINKLEVFRWLTYPPPWAQTWSPLALTLLMIRRAFGPFARWELTLLVSCLSLIVADEFRTSLGDLSGRYWPETWFHDNPSLIGNDAYGFHPFVHGDDVGSFPSGHAARILGFAGVWWLAIPASRVIWAALCPPLLGSLVAMNYHFVGDVVAGSLLGGIVAAHAVFLSDLRRPAEAPES